MRFHRCLLTLLLLAAPLMAQSAGPVSLTGSQCASIAVDSRYSTVAVQVTGTWSGTIQPEASVQGQAAANIQVTPSTSTTAQNTITANGIYRAAVAGMSVFYVCGNTITNTAVVYLNASAAINASAFGGGSGGSGTVTSIATTSPIGGGTITGTGTLTCTTCVTSAAALTANKVVIGGGSQTSSAIDFPDVKFIPAANCSNATAGNGWSIGSGGTVSCRAGTNNLGGFIAITDTSSTFATFQLAVPEDWDTAANPFVRFQVASSDATNGHTIIPSIQVGCYKGDGSTTDDVAANAAHSLSTVTLNGNSNRFWSTGNVQMNSTDVTGCVAGALMQITVGRATDSATQAAFYGATITFPRLIAVQAN